LYFGVFACLFSSGFLCGKVLFLSQLEKGYNVVGIVGIDAEDWVLTEDRKYLKHEYIDKKELQNDKAYKSCICKIIKQQLSCDNYKNLNIDFLLEGRNRRGKSPLFPLKLLSFYEKEKKKYREQNQSNFSCCNIWDELIECLCLYVCKVFDSNNKTCDYFHAEWSLGYLKGFFMNIKNQYRKVLKSAKIKSLKNDLSEENVFFEYEDGIKDIIETIDYFCKKFKGNTNIFRLIKKIIHNTAPKKKKHRCKDNDCCCDFCKIIDIVDNISNYFWNVRYFTQIFKAQMKENPSKTIIICEVNKGIALENMLLEVGYKKTYCCFKDCRQESEEKMIPPLLVKTFINHVIGGCNFCGKQASKQCSACKNVWYCCGQCQNNDWKQHKNICVRMTACNVCKNGSAQAVKCDHCNGVAYCGKKCQSENWEKHKISCKKSR